MAGDEALECALRALRHRDRSVHELAHRLRARGFSAPECERAIETLVRTGLADDARYAEARAASLAARGASDALIRHALAEAGVDEQLMDDALESIEPETSRARHIVARRGIGPKTARYLSGKGFTEEAVACAVAGEADDELG